MGDERPHEFGNGEEFVAENEARKREGGFGAEIEFGIGKEESYSNKRMKEMSIDRLSSLPDAVLLHIFSFFCFDLKHTAVTSVLSKRWQFLWSELTVLNFRDRSWNAEKTRDFVSWVHRTIILRSGAYNLEKLEVDFLYDECYSLDVNAWVRFAVRNNVRELTLELYSNRYFCTLPQVMYTNSSFTYLYLQRCIVAPQKKIEWRYLTQLTVRDVELHDDVIQEILSGCPVLLRLYLISCWGFKRLDVNSESFHDLMVLDCKDKNNVDLLEISAPYLRSLHISFCPIGKKLQLTNVASLESAKIDFDALGESVEVMNNTKELLEKTQHAKLLALGGAFVEVVSELVLHGWRLPQSRRDCLSLETSRDEDSIPGILALLESSPNIDTLLIEGLDDYVKSARTWIPAARNDLDRDLLNLKIVRLLDFADPNLGGEPMLTIARILLKRATSLEKMKIKACGCLTEFPSHFAKMSETVNSYPRSSEKAGVVFRQ